MGINLEYIELGVLSAAATYGAGLLQNGQVPTSLVWVVAVLTVIASWAYNVVTNGGNPVPSALATEAAVMQQAPKQ